MHNMPNDQSKRKCLLFTRIRKQIIRQILQKNRFQYLVVAIAGLKAFWFVTIWSCGELQLQVVNFQKTRIALFFGKCMLTVNQPNYDLGNIGNMDESSIYVDCPSACTYTNKGAKRAR